MEHFRAPQVMYCKVYHKDIYEYIKLTIDHIENCLFEISIDHLGSCGILMSSELSKKL